jgi:hypothetical protein
MEQDAVMPAPADAVLRLDARMSLKLTWGQVAARRPGRRMLDEMLAVD